MESKKEYTFRSRLFPQAEVLYNFWKKYGNKFLNFNFLKEFIFKNRMWIALIGIWLISLLFEANGGRSNQIGRSILELPIKDTLNCLASLLASSKTARLGTLSKKTI